MKKKVMKKALAGMLAVTMVLGMSMVALAADETTGNVTGAGEFEGHVAKKVVAVTLPTNVPASTFAYKMDPEGLIPATNNAKYSGATFEPGANVYFQSATNTYTKDSAKLKVINKGTADVDVTIKAEVPDGGAVAMAAAGTFADTNKNAELYLGLVVANKPAVAVKEAANSGGEQKVGLKGNSDNFEITYKDNAYGYTPKTGVPETAWNSFEFYLTGACNPNGDYSANALEASDVTVTWSYVERPTDSLVDMLAGNAVADAAPSVETKTYTMTNGQDVLVDISLGGGNLGATGVSSVSYVAGGRTYSFVSGEYKIENGKLVLNHTKTDAFVSGGIKDREITIQFNDTAKTTGKVILTTAD